MANIAVVMVDGVADWEIGVVLPAAREWFGDQVAIASIDGQPVHSIGGLRITPEFALSDLAPLDADLWILPGSERWQAGEIPGLSGVLCERVQQQRPIAAICGATIALAYAVCSTSGRTPAIRWRSCRSTWCRTPALRITGTRKWSAPTA